MVAEILAAAAIPIAVRRAGGEPECKDKTMNKLFTRFAGWCAWSFGHPLAFILACLATAAWAVSGPVFNYSDTWQLVINTGTTVATFLMIFVLQHSQNRDSTAIQAKLDELIRASAASNKLIRAEQLTEAEVEELRAEFKSPPRRKTIAARASSKSSHVGEGKD